VRAEFSWPDRRDADGDTLLSRASWRCRERLYVDLQIDRHLAGDEPHQMRVELFVRRRGGELTWAAEPLASGGATALIELGRWTPFRVRARLIDVVSGDATTARGSVLIIPRVSRALAVTLSLACAAFLIWGVWMINSISWASPTQRLFAGSATVIALASPIYISALELTGILHKRALSDWRIPGLAALLLFLGAATVRSSVVWIANTTGRPLQLDNGELPARSNQLLWRSSAAMPATPAPLCLVATSDFDLVSTAQAAPATASRPCSAASSSATSPLYAFAASRRLLLGCPTGSDEDCCTPREGERTLGAARVRWALRSASCEAELPGDGNGAGFVALTLDDVARSHELEMRQIDGFERYTVSCASATVGAETCSVPIPSRGAAAMMSLRLRRAGRDVGTLDCRIGKDTLIAALTVHQPGLARVVYRSGSGEVQSDWRAATPDYGDPPLFCDNGGQLPASSTLPDELKLCLTGHGVDLSRWALELGSGSPLSRRSALRFALQEDDRTLGTVSCSGAALEGGFVVTDFALSEATERLVSVSHARSEAIWQTLWQPSALGLTQGWGCFPFGWSAADSRVQQPPGDEVRESVGTEARGLRHPIATVFKPRPAASPCTRLGDGSWQLRACRERPGKASCVTIKNWADKPDALTCDERTSWQCSSPLSKDCE
jgi:hypothetical protein